MLSSYMSWAMTGGALMTSASAPPWLGWTGVAAGCLLTVGFLAARGGPFAPPILAHVYPLAVGISLLLHPPQ